VSLAGRGVNILFFPRRDEVRRSLDGRKRIGDSSTIGYQRSGE